MQVSLVASLVVHKYVHVLVRSSKVHSSATRHTMVAQCSEIQTMATIGVHTGHSQMVWFVVASRHVVLMALDTESEIPLFLLSFAPTQPHDHLNHSTIFHLCPMLLAVFD